MRTIYIFSIMILVIIYACTEPIPLKTVNFESALVVEGTLTNQNETQKIKLSRTYLLEDTEPIIENNATVWVENNNGDVYQFVHASEGVYTSTIPFASEENIFYKLHISTQDGNEYESTEVQLTSESQIDNLYAELTTNDEGENGIQVYIDNFNQNSSAEYFRYEYEETYKIIAPNYSSQDITISNYNYSEFTGEITYDIDITYREQEEQTCYINKKGIGLILATSENYETNSLERIPIKFIPTDDGSIRERYSINVKQFVQSVEAYTFYKAIEDLGNVQSILTQSQPGYINGNIKSINSTSEKIIGYFDISSTTSKRVYFNYFDFGIPKPEYLYECQTKVLDYGDATTLDEDPNERITLYQDVYLRNFKLSYYSEAQISPITGEPTIYEITNPECGDCTTLGSNIEPDFWED